MSSDYAARAERERWRFLRGWRTVGSVAGTTVLTIGTFDGVHVGHAAIVRCARAIADSGTGRGRVVALSFDPHPASVLRPGTEPPRLTVFDDRAALMRAAGADEVVRLQPTPDLLALSPERFIVELVDRFAPSAFVEGPDFHFGRGRSGSVRTLAEQVEPMGLSVSVVEPVTAELEDQSVVTASSSMVRWLIGRGRIRDAARVLGRPYQLVGTVVQGDRRGRVIGFPTANLSTPCLLAGDGVYAGVARLGDGRSFAAAVHIGPRATFDDERRTAEVHILDWDGPVAEGGAEYGWTLRVDLVSWLRDQAKFESVDELVRQIERDVERSRGAVAPDRSESARRPGVKA